MLNGNLTKYGSSSSSSFSEVCRNQNDMHRRGDSRIARAYCATHHKPVGTGVLDGSCIYYTTIKFGTQYHTVSTFIIFSYGNIITQYPFFPAHAAGANTFARVGKRSRCFASAQNLRKRTGRPLDSACLIAVAYATSKAYGEVYGRFMYPRFCK